MNWQLKKFDELAGIEIYEILKARCEVFVVEQNCPYQDPDDKDKRAYHLYLNLKGEVAAYVRILERGVSYKEISIGRVLCVKKYRGNGFARMAMKKAIEFIETQLNEDVIRISAQSYLTEFYCSLGFETVGEEYLEDDIPHIEMIYVKK